MSTQTTLPDHIPEYQDMPVGDDDRGYGWVMFAAAMLAMLGTLNFIQGIAAVSKSSFFVGDAHYVIGDLNTWGWVVMIVGAIQVVAAVAVLFKSQAARWAGVALAIANAISQILFMPAYPFWSMVLFALDILVIYGLVAYGRRSPEPA